MEIRIPSFLTSALEALKANWKTVVIFLTPVAWIWLLLLDESVGPKLAMRCLYVMVIMSTFWVTSAMPLAVTSLIPVALFPLLGIQGTVRTQPSRSPS